MSATSGVRSIKVYPLKRTREEVKHDAIGDFKMSLLRYSDSALRSLRGQLMDSIASLEKTLGEKKMCLESLDEFMNPSVSERTE
jgi:hypothetical protein